MKINTIWRRISIFWNPEIGEWTTSLCPDSEGGGFHSLHTLEAMSIPDVRKEKEIGFAIITFAVAAYSFSKKPRTGLIDTISRSALSHKATASNTGNGSQFKICLPIVDDFCEEVFVFMLDLFTHLGITSSEQVYRTHSWEERVLYICEKNSHYIGLEKKFMSSKGWGLNIADSFVMPDTEPLS